MNGNNLYNKIKDPNEALRLLGIETPETPTIPFAPEVSAEEVEEIRTEQPTPILPHNYNELAQAEANEQGVEDESVNSIANNPYTQPKASPTPPEAPKSKEESILEQYRKAIADREAQIASGRSRDSQNEMLDNINKSFSQIGNSIANRSGRIKVDQVAPIDLKSQAEKQALGDSGRSIESLMTEYKMIQDEQAKKAAADRAKLEQGHRDELLQLQKDQFGFNKEKFDRQQQLEREKLLAAENIAKLKGQNKGSKFNEEQMKQLGKASTTYYTQDRDQLISNANKLDTAISKIDEAKSGPVSGPARGLIPNMVRHFSNPEAVEVEQAIQSAITDTLRPTLGAQFTEKEGERIMNLQYDPQASPAENRRRANELKKFIQKKVEATDALYEHLGKGEPLNTFDFKKYGMQAGSSVNDTSGDSSSNKKSSPSVGSVISSKGKKYRVIDDAGNLEEI